MIQCALEYKRHHYGHIVCERAGKKPTGDKILVNQLRSALCRLNDI